MYLTLITCVLHTLTIRKATEFEWFILFGRFHGILSFEYIVPRPAGTQPL